MAGMRSSGRAMPRLLRKRAEPLPRPLGAASDSSSGPDRQIQLMDPGSEWATVILP